MSHGGAWSFREQEEMMLDDEIDAHGNRIKIEGVPVWPTPTERDRSFSNLRTNDSHDYIAGTRMPALEAQRRLRIDTLRVRRGLMRAETTEEKRWIRDYDLLVDEQGMFLDQENWRGLIRLGMQLVEMRRTNPELAFIGAITIFIQPPRNYFGASLVQLGQTWEGIIHGRLSYTDYPGAGTLFGSWWAQTTEYRTLSNRMQTRHIPFPQNVFSRSMATRVGPVPVFRQRQEEMMDRRTGAERVKKHTLPPRNEGGHRSKRTMMEDSDRLGDPRDRNRDEAWQDLGDDRQVQMAREEGNEQREKLREMREKKERGFRELDNSMEEGEVEDPRLPMGSRTTPIPFGKPNLLITTRQSARPALPDFSVTIPKSSPMPTPMTLTINAVQGLNQREPLRMPTPEQAKNTVEHYVPASKEELISHVKKSNFFLQEARGEPPEHKPRWIPEASKTRRYSLDVENAKKERPMGDLVAAVTDVITQGFDPSEEKRTVPVMCGSEARFSIDLMMKGIRSRIHVGSRDTRQRDSAGGVDGSSG